MMIVGRGFGMMCWLLNFLGNVSFERVTLTFFDFFSC